MKLKFFTTFALSVLMATAAYSVTITEDLRSHDNPGEFRNVRLKAPVSVNKVDVSYARLYLPHGYSFNQLLSDVGAAKIKGRLSVTGRRTNKYCYFVGDQGAAFKFDFNLNSQASTDDRRMFGKRDPGSESDTVFPLVKSLLSLDSALFSKDNTCGPSTRFQALKSCLAGYNGRHLPSTDRGDKFFAYARAFVKESTEMPEAGVARLLMDREFSPRLYAASNRDVYNSVSQLSGGDRVLAITDHYHRYVLCGNEKRFRSSLPRNFGAITYMLSNRDLRENYGSLRGLAQVRALQEHYLLSGRDEIAQGKRVLTAFPAGFDWYIYMLSNPDLKETFGSFPDRKRRLMVHYLDHGKDEIAQGKRVLTALPAVLCGNEERLRSSLPRNFSVITYMLSNRDLRENYGSLRGLAQVRALQEHYLLSGRKEIAQGKRVLTAFPAGFDWYIYMLSNPDLKETFGSFPDRKRRLMVHYLDHGKDEIGQGKRVLTTLPAEFDWEVYMLSNRDLRENYGSLRGLAQVRALQEHYLLSGRDEIAQGKRVLTAFPAGFDWYIYMLSNPDLKETFGSFPDRKRRLMVHYLDHGKDEIGQGKRVLTTLPAEFDWEVYMLSNRDLRENYGSLRGLAQVRALQEHYLDHGRGEIAQGKRVLTALPAGFDPAGYLRNNSDVAAALQNIPTDAEKHRQAKLHWLRYHEAEPYRIW